MTSPFPRLSEDAMKRMLEPPTGPVRLILDTDTYNEIDDQYALAWMLLSQDQLVVEGVVAEPYSFRHHQRPMQELYDLLSTDPGAKVPDPWRSYEPWIRNLIRIGNSPYDMNWVSTAEGMELSYQEILTVFEKMDEDPEGKVFRGSPGYLQSLDEPFQNPGVDFIIERALAGEDDPLYIAAIGCPTNVASAILLEPKIIEHIVVIWTSAYPSNVTLSNAPSLNLMQDKLASQLLFDSGVPHVYLPGYQVGAQIQISLPDMERWVMGKGAIGDYLYHLYTHNPIHALRGITDQFGRTRVIWDMINIAWLLNPDWVPSQLVRSPILNDQLFWEHDPHRHLMREAYGCNRDAIFRDFFRKLDEAA